METANSPTANTASKSPGKNSQQQFAAARNIVHRSKGNLTRALTATETCQKSLEEAVEKYQAHAVAHEQMYSAAKVVCQPQPTKQAIRLRQDEQRRDKLAAAQELFNATKAARIYCQELLENVKKHKTDIAHVLKDIDSPWHPEDRQASLCDMVTEHIKSKLQCIDIMEAKVNDLIKVTRTGRGGRRDTTAW